MKTPVNVFQNSAYSIAYLNAIFTTFELPKVKTYSREAQEYTGFKTLDYFIELFLQQFEVYHFYRTESLEIFYWYVVKFYEPKKKDDPLYLDYTIGEAKFRIIKNMFHNQVRYASFNISANPFTDFRYSRSREWPERAVKFELDRYRTAFKPEHEQLSYHPSKETVQTELRQFKVDILRQITPNTLKEKLYFRVLKHKLL